MSPRAAAVMKSPQSSRWRGPVGTGYVPKCLLAAERRIRVAAEIEYSRITGPMGAKPVPVVRLPIGSVAKAGGDP
jgi:hypothetical protein